MKKTAAQKTMVITKARKIDASAVVGSIIVVDGTEIKVVASRAKKTAETETAETAETETAETETEKALKKAVSDLQSAEKRAAVAETKAAEAEETARHAVTEQTAIANAAAVIVKENTEADAEAVKHAEQAAKIVSFNGAEMDRDAAEAARKKEAERAEAAEAEAREKAAKIAARVGMPELTIHGNGYIRDGKTTDVTEFVKFYIASDIARKCRNVCAGYKEQLADNHPKIDFMTVSDDKLFKLAKEFHMNGGKGRAYTAAEAGKVVDDRNALVYAEEQLAEQTKTQTDWNQLSIGAKNSVKLYAIRNYNGATLDKETLDTGRKDAKGKPIYLDFTAPAKKAYELRGSLNALADTVRGLVNRAFPVNELTYGLSMTISDILTADNGFCISSFAAALGGTAHLDDNGKFLYFLNTKYTNVLKAFLTFVSVMVEVGAFKARDFKQDAETEAAHK